MALSKKVNCPIFIVGCPRSGTTLLRDLLQSHPHLAFPTESNFIPQFYRAFGDPKDATDAERLANRILNLFWVKCWELDLDPADFREDRRFAEMIDRLYGAFAALRGKIRWGDKTPMNVMHIPTLVEIFPQAKVIHIYRDGRDVALSWLPFHAGPGNLYTAALGNLYTAALLWRETIRAGEYARQTLPSSTYMQVRYEDLITDVSGIMKTICDFVDEPYNDAVTTPTRSPYDNTPGLFKPRRNPRVAEQTVISQNALKWKTKMSRTDRILFESVAQAELDALGYEIEGVTRPISSTQRLAWKASHILTKLFESLNRTCKHQWVPSHLMIRYANLKAKLH